MLNRIELTLMVPETQFLRASVGHAEGCYPEARRLLCCYVEGRTKYFRQKTRFLWLGA